MGWDVLVAVDMGWMLLAGSLRWSSWRYRSCDGVSSGLGHVVVPCWTGGFGCSLILALGCSLHLLGLRASPWWVWSSYCSGSPFTSSWSLVPRFLDSASLGALLRLPGTPVGWLGLLA